MKKQTANYKDRYRPYLIAMALAFVLTMIVAPEMMEGKGMEPSVKDKSVVVMTKQSYSEKRGHPELNDVVVVEKFATKAFRDDLGAKNDNIIARVKGLPGDTISDEKLLGNYEGPVKLEGGQVWLLLDNIPKTTTEQEFHELYLDSRVLGPIELKDIRGKVIFIAWPISEIGGIK